VVAEIMRHRLSRVNEVEDTDNLALPPDKQNTPRSIQTLVSAWLSPRAQMSEEKTRSADEVRAP
jgi:hypothetical protein